MSGKRYRLYIDESGDHTYKKIGQGRDQYLALCACMIEKNYLYDSIIPNMENIKKRYFKNHCAEKPVIFHRLDMIHKEGPFVIFRNEEIKREFDKDLLTYMSINKYRIITVVIDKKAHIEKHGKNAWHPYHYCLEVILERYCGYLKYTNAEGDIMAESRGKREDKELREAYKELFNKGTHYCDYKDMQKVLTSDKLKTSTKDQNEAGLQISDLLACPSRDDVLKHSKRITEEDIGPFSQKMISIIEGKYNRQFRTNEIKGYGRIFLA